MREREREREKERENTIGHNVWKERWFHERSNSDSSTLYTMPKTFTTVVLIMVMLVNSHTVSSSSSLEIDVVLIDMTESWVFSNPDRVIDVASEATSEYFRQEGSVVLENVTVVVSSSGTSALVKASGGEWVLMGEIVDQGNFTQSARAVRCLLLSTCLSLQITPQQRHTHTHTQECESLLLVSQQNNVLTNRIKSKFNLNGWAAAYTNSFNAFARLRAQEELPQSGVGDTTVLVSLILMGLVIIFVIGFVLFATLRKRN